MAGPGSGIVVVSPSSRDLLQSVLPQEPLHGGDPAVLPPQLSPDLARSVPPSAFIVDAPDHLDGFGVLFGPVGRFSGVAGDGGMRIIGRRSDRQDAADRLDSAASRCFSMKAIICGTGGRAPLGQNRPTPSSGISLAARRLLVLALQLLDPARPLPDVALPLESSERFPLNSRTPRTRSSAGCLGVCLLSGMKSLLRVSGSFV